MEKKLTLIIPTLGRKQELVDLLESLCSCENKEKIELIIVDQNPLEYGLEKIIQSFKLRLDIIYILSNKKGLSHNRNKAIQMCELNDYVLFTDDDNIFDSLFFTHLLFHISSIKNFDLLVANALNIEDKKPYTYAINQQRVEKLKFKNFKKVISWNIIIPKIELDKIGLFDESFGVGSQYGACEESDFILRILTRNRNQTYSLPDCKVFHQKRAKNYNNFKRNINYAFGFGAFYKKQIIKSSLILKFYFFFDFLKLLILSSIGLFMYFFDKNRRIHYRNSLLYKLKGFVIFK